MPENLQPNDPVEFREWFRDLLNKFDKRPIPPTLVPHDPWATMRSTLKICLQAAVPLNIMEMHRRGGINDGDLKFCHEFALVLGEKGDILMFRGKQQGETAKVFNGLARCIGIMSFCSGGVTFLDDKWVSQDYLPTFMEAEQWVR